MAEPLLHVENLGKRFGGFVALDGINLEVAPGEARRPDRPETAPASATLVNCMCGTLQNETAPCCSDGHAMNGLSAHQRTHRGMARSFQLPRPFGTLSWPKTCVFRCFTRRTAGAAAPVARRDRKPVQRARPAPRWARAEDQSPAARPDAGRDAQARSLPAPWRPIPSC